jgi:hypothetical protein
VRHRAANDEAASLDAGHLIDLFPGPRADELVDAAAECAGVAEKGGNVAEDDAGPRIIGDAAD